MTSNSSSLSGVASSVRGALNIGGVPGLETNESIFPSLSYRTRLIGFCTCFCGGMILSIVSLIFLWTAKLTGFAVIYTTVNLLSIFALMFLVGPAKQCATMFDKTRVIATAVYFTTMICTLIVAFVAPNPGLACIILVVIQFLAGTWYALSYIPFARRLVMSCFSNFTGTSDIV